MGGKIPVARPIEDVVEDCQKIFISKLPGNKMVAAGWAAFCEAWREYEFAQNVIDGEKSSEIYLWLNHGRHQMAASIIRRIADGLGVENVTWREATSAEGAVE